MRAGYPAGAGPNCVRSFRWFLPITLRLRRFWLCLLLLWRRRLGARLLLSLLTHLLRRSARRSLLAGWLLTHLPLLRCNHARLLGWSILRWRPALETLLRWLWSQLLLRVAHGWRPLYF